jgi:hypothetical protein
LYEPPEPVTILSLALARERGARFGVSFNSLHIKDTKLSEVVGQYNEAKGTRIRFKGINHPFRADFQKMKEVYYEPFSIVHKISIQRYLGLLDERSRSFIPKDSKVCMRIHADALKGIIERNDSFKSIHATSTSNILSNSITCIDDVIRLDTTTRLDTVKLIETIISLNIEKIRIGNYRSKVPGELRPIYGYIATSEQPLGSPGKEHYLDQYGHVAIVFKDEVRRRTSFMVGDSLVDEALAVPFESPNGDCFPLGPPITAMDIRQRDPLSKGFGDWIPYVEAQIHYGASLQDVEYVVLAGSAAYDKDLIALLQKYDISIYPSSTS